MKLPGQKGGGLSGETLGAERKEGISDGGRDPEVKVNGLVVLNVQSTSCGKGNGSVRDEPREVGKRIQVFFLQAPVFKLKAKSVLERAFV